MIGGRFAPLTIMSNEGTDIDSMITTFNTAVTETASKKHEHITLYKINQTYKYTDKPKNTMY